MPVQIQLRRDNAATWASVNPILAQGEPGYETDTGLIKYGTGVDHWNDLDYFGPAITGAAGGVLAGTYPNPSFASDMATQTELNVALSAVVQDGDPAGGVLTGTYPNPTFAADMATQAELDAVAAAKANLASPTFTGNPAAPTPAANDNDTSIATTAFVASKQPLNVLDYGVVGNGVADDTTALQAWVNAVKTAKGYGVCPNGLTFLVSNKIQFGLGTGGIWDFAGSVIKKSNTFSIDRVVDLRGSCEIRNLTIDGNKAGGAAGAGVATDVVNVKATLRNVISLNNATRGFTVGGVTGCTYKLYGCIAQGNTQQGFYCAGTPFILDRDCEGNDNATGFMADGGTPDCQVNGSFRRNLANGVLINGLSPGGQSNWLYCDDNANFGLIMQNPGGTFVGPTNWSFGYVEVNRTGAAAAGTYTQNNAGTGFEGYGITNCTFDRIIGRGNLGYDVALLQSDATHPSAYNQINSIYGNDVGPTGVTAADNDPSVIIGGGSHHNHIGRITSIRKTIALALGEASNTHDSNYFDEIFCYGNSYAAVVFNGGAYNYIGTIVSREVSMGHSAGPTFYLSVVQYQNSAACHHNLIDRLDHYTAGTAFTYLVESKALPANNQVTKARGAFVTAIQLDANGSNTTTAG